MKLNQFLPIVIMSVIIGCNDDEQRIPGPMSFASAEIVSVSSEDGENYTPGEAIGEASVVYQDGVTTLEVSIDNMTPNTSHAMHLHMGTLEVPGHHWNQGVFTAFCNERSLGKVWAKPFAGDVGNIDIGSDGTGSFSLSTDLWSINTGDATDIVGTVLYIHENEEDFITECDPNHEHNHGHTNAKIAGGTIIFQFSETDEL